MTGVKNIIYPFEISDVDPETQATLRDHFDGDFGGFVRVGPKGYFYPKAYEKVALPIYNMETLPGQVFVGGYPRSGTTWMQQIIWLIIHDLDYAECEKTSMRDKFPFMEKRALLPVELDSKQKNESLAAFTEQNVPLPLGHPFLKTHLPLSLLPPTLLESSKMVYVARDPRDVIVSFYHHLTGLYFPYRKDFKTFWGSFLKGTCLFCPYFEGVKEFWKKRHDPNLLFLFYEDIVNDLKNTLRRVAEFFNKSYTEEQLVEACRYLDFNNLKNNKSFTYKREGPTLIRPDGPPSNRKGVAGGWREYFDEEMIRETDQWLADNLRGIDLVYPSIHID